ncbi:type II secretion system protein [Photobacterium leiognathi]|uniref:type II secretion system protein n=1 Tax=Photobacterium leiognathi TaxID=553611 RepID=UPI0027349F72|nr:type II secretion system protein [Photobacterium leiognathi]
MKRDSGFTLIELIVVIVILGILAVVAAPKFLNIHKDARIASLKGAKGALTSAFSMFSAKVDMPNSKIITKQLGGTSVRFLKINGQEIRINDIDNFPLILLPLYAGDSKDKPLKDIQALADIDLSYDAKSNEGKADFNLVVTGDGGFYIFPKTDRFWSDKGEIKQCSLEYIPATTFNHQTSHFELHLSDC